MYDFDISRECRTNHVVRAKKVFIQLCWKYGHRVGNYAPVINVTHANCIFHQKNFHSIFPIDLQMYNACIRYFNLPLEQYGNLFSLNESNEMNNIISQLRNLNKKELIEFKRLKVDTYFKEREFEKEYRNVLVESK